MTKGHTAACPHQVTLGERCRRGDVRLCDCRQVSAAAWTPWPVTPVHNPSWEPLSGFIPAPRPVQAIHRPGSGRCCGSAGVSSPPLIPRASPKSQPKGAIQLQECMKATCYGVGENTRTRSVSSTRAHHESS